jgi:hypothetical protein
MVTKKRNRTPQLNVYFSAHEQRFLEKLIMASQKYKISESRLAAMAMKNGLHEAVKELDTQKTRAEKIEV